MLMVFLYIHLYDGVCISFKVYCVLPLHSVHFTDDDMLQESGIYTGQLMILEVKKADGTWPRDTYTQATMVCIVHTHIVHNIFYIYSHSAHAHTYMYGTCSHNLLHMVRMYVYVIEIVQHGKVI